LISILFNNVKSTQDIPNFLLNKVNYKKILLIQSFYQTMGIGRYNRQWHSPKGNLYFTMIFNYKKKYITSMNTFICYLLHSYFKKKFNVKFDYKWPNDLYFKDQKVMGILTQNIILGPLCTFKIGIGINVNNKIKNKNFRSTSLGLILGEKINLLDLSSSLQKYLNSNIFTDFDNLTISNYLNKNLIKNSTSYIHHFNSSISEQVKVLSLNKDFSLKIRQDNLIKNITYGEIR
tara:strand:+ start:1205 stop:1903 length:699 start_codon:yes stop_codon:yes gene_type:complete